MIFCKLFSALALRFLWWRFSPQSAHFPLNDVNEDTDDRATHAIAYQWASRITTVSLEMVVPGALGIFVDRRLGTVVLFTLVGFGVGLTLGIVHLLRMTGSGSESE